MADKFVPLTGQLLDEGEFMRDVNAELQDLQHALIMFVRQYREKAESATAKLQVEIAVKCESVDSEAFSIKCSMKATHPKRPSSVSMAMAGESDDAGKMVLFVRASGSDDMHPKTGKLFTRDGRNIVDGEAVE